MNTNSLKPTTDAYRLWSSGLWIDNPALVKLLGLCPLLAVSNNVINGLGLGIATLLTLVVANALTSITRPLFNDVYKNSYLCPYHRNHCHDY